MAMYSTVGTDEPDRAKAFYDDLLAPIGMKKMFDHPKGGRIYRSDKGDVFGVLTPHDGGAASAGNGSMVGFGLPTTEAIDAFHAKALELGGTCEGPPGERGTAGSGVYFAYVRDLDGNKLCAYKFG